MTNFQPLIPRQPVPRLDVMVGGAPWRLADQKPQRFSLIVFYRGFHCPICGSYLPDVQRRLDAFRERGVEPIAISSDGEDRARMAVEKWGLDKLKIGYSLSLDNAREWGLFISSQRGPKPTPTGVVEPPLFSEPGMFLVRPDGTLYFASVQTMPFTRPNMGEVIKGLDVVIAEDYPARGEVVDHKAAMAALARKTG